MVFRNALHRGLPVRQEILNVSQIAVALHGIRPPFIVHAPLQQHRRCPFLNSTLLFQQSHLLLIWVVLTYHDSMIIPRKTCQIPRNCQCKWLLVSSSAPGTSSGSSGSPKKFSFCTGMIVSTVLPSLVPRLHIDDCFAIHFLHWEFCDPELSSHQHFPLLARLYQYVFCKKLSLFSSSSRYRNVGPSESACRHYAYPTPFHFCSQLHWYFMRRTGSVSMSKRRVSPWL